ncbi:MAG: histidine phosphatase family protein [Cuniculiplasma divulgatum]|nr:MAG: histidine phosphatase family protein [Cuniculiplasma divulgatum]
MAKIFVVRHAETEAVPNIPADQWKLKDGSFDAIKTMMKGVDITDVQTIYYSPLVKAKHTALIISEFFGIALEERQCLREVERYFGFIDEETFRTRVLEYFSGCDDQNFESYSTARDRIISCLKSLIAGGPGKSILIVSHGMIISILYSHLLGVSKGYGDWQKIKMPDLSILDMDNNVVEKGFFQGFKIKNPLWPGPDSKDDSEPRC